MSKNIPSKKVYAIVISYKSSPVLGDLYRRINKDNFDKIYFFDDNSPDNSAEEAKKYDWIVIKNPIVAVPSTTQGQIGFAPWSPLLQKDKIEVTKKYLVYIGEPQEEIIEQYKSMFGKISTPTKKLIL